MIDLPPPPPPPPVRQAHDVATIPQPRRVVRATRSRLAAAAAAGAGVVVFLVAAWIHPYDANGQALLHGTHRQLGLPPCLMLRLTGMPCLSCGMTTSVSLVMHGDLTAAVRANWAGAVISMLGFVAVTWLMFLAISGAQPRCLTVEMVGRWLAISAVTVAGSRYLVILLTKLFSMPGPP